MLSRSQYLNSPGPVLAVAHSQCDGIPKRASSDSTLLTSRANQQLSDGQYHPPIGVAKFGPADDLLGATLASQKRVSQDKSGHYFRIARRSGGLSARVAGQVPLPIFIYDLSGQILR
jgi:hypothetical protein